MATGGEGSKHSTDGLEFLCCVCTNENKKTKAVKYCETCEDYYCGECVNLHYIVPFLSAHDIVERSDLRGTCGPYRIERKVETRVKEEKDKKDCHIPGSCILKDGSILLADNDNRCLKRLSPMATSVSECLPLSCCPCSVAVISQKEAVVTLPYQKQVKTIAFNPVMIITRTLRLDFKCYCITAYNNELFISDGRFTAYIYTIAGELLRKIKRNNKGQRLFSCIRNMAVSKKGRVLFVADYGKGLIAVERKTSRLLWCYKETDLEGATGVCVDGRGGVFVCGNWSHNVLQFSQRGAKICEIAKRADWVLAPWSLCFNTEASRLVVTTYNNDVMQYDLAT